MAAPEKDGEAQKLRFGQWLLNAINSGSYRGLRWIDSARTIFRVPWKHNARKDITSSDLEVFKLELHPQDTASAIAVPGSTDPTELSILEELLQQCDISPRNLGSLAPSWVPAGDTPHQDIMLQPHQDTVLQPIQDTVLQLHQDTVLQPIQDTLLQPYADTSQNSCFPPTTFPQWVPTVEQPTLDTYQPTGLVPPEEAGPMQYAAEATLFVPAASPLPQPRLLLDNTNGIVSILDVTIYYRGKEFHREVVGGSHCLLTYQPPSLPGPPCPWHVVHFPSPASLADSKQRRITEELLGIAGLQLEQRAYKVFATRREKCKVFWALSQQLEGVEEPPPNLLCRDRETPIFDFNEFCMELRDFRNGQRRRSPDFTIYLCFGQAFSKAKPKESKLILVKLVPKFCEYYYEQVLREGASSLDSHTISLQLSNSFDLMELIEQYTMQLG
ncbi:interferon regulatory factor 7 isoform X3 [Pyrgilauda ruficollis]|uniref:interferon regulatory factor 7 isoform X3 n=1 Tax=Pyrgilauda ruficollis TaxID=221976 RepID=UPI001B880B4B|nr:interferon regulatory factor 7 isoform X3 [Pyrgilauda ruficollis]